jgi:hypothetical protein
MEIPDSNALKKKSFTPIYLQLQTKSIPLRKLFVAWKEQKSTIVF